MKFYVAYDVSLDVKQSNTHILISVKLSLALVVKT